MRPETLFTGQQIIRLASVDSTNNYTTELIRHSVISEGTIVVAEEQTAGRGQRGSHWVSTPGANLTCSIYLQPHFVAAGQQFLLNQIASLAVCDVLLALNVANVSIKWPNDILCGDRKICGILIENGIRQNHLQYAIVGIGINVNQSDFLSFKRYATSILLETGVRGNTDEVLGLLASKLEARYLQGRSQAATLGIDYHKHLYLLDENSEFHSAGEDFHGTIRGVGQTGELEIETIAGLRRFGFKEVEFLR